MRRVVFISSGAVYGEQELQPLRETAAPNPQSPYAVSKLASEYYLRTIGKLWDIETVILRLFNVYGPGQHFPPVHAPVIPYFLRQALNNGNIVVHGDGQQTRDYVYIDDAVNAMTAAASASAANQRIINVGSGIETSTRELVRQVIEVTGSSPQVIYNPRNEGGVRRMCADLSLASELLGYQCSVPLFEGLRSTLEHTRAQRAG